MLLWPCDLRISNSWNGPMAALSSLWNVCQLLCEMNRKWSASVCLFPSWLWLVRATCSPLKQFWLMALLFKPYIITGSHLPDIVTDNFLQHEEPARFHGTCVLLFNTAAPGQSVLRKLTLQLLHNIVLNQLYPVNKPVLIKDQPLSTHVNTSTK